MSESTDIVYYIATSQKNLINLRILKQGRQVGMSWGLRIPSAIDPNSPLTSTLECSANGPIDKLTSGPFRGRREFPPNAERPS
jgi:hypothetical protein